MPSKKIRLRLYADENFPVPSATYLKSLGVSIVHAYDRKLINKNDKIHIKEVKKLKRTIITIDRDFLYFSELASKKSYGAIVISTGNATYPHINKICKKALPKISSQKAKSSFIKITTSKIIFLKDESYSSLSI